MDNLSARSPLQVAALLVGAVFVLVGVLGFIPGITQDYDNLGWVNEDGAELLGIFGVNITHNLLHLALGLVGIAAAATAALAYTYLLVGGLAYLGLFVYGILIDLDSGWNFAAINTADNWLHIGLSVVMIALAFTLPRRVARTDDDVDAIEPARSRRGTRPRVRS